MTFGQRIQDCRRRAGLSQEQLAAQLGVSRQAVSKWELDAAQPELDKVVAMAELFGITTDELLLGRAPQATPAPAKESAPPRWYLLGLIPTVAGAYLLFRGLWMLVQMQSLLNLVG